MTKGGWAPPAGNTYPIEAVDPRVIKQTTVYRGNPPPPDGWKYWPAGKKIKPAGRQLAVAGTTREMGTFVQILVDGEVIACRTEWHPFTVLATGNRQGLYRGGSLMVPVEQPKPSGPKTSTTR